MGRSGVLAAAMAVVVPLGVATADDWPVAVGGHPSRDGRSAEVGPASATILWHGSRPAIVAQQGAAFGDLLVVNRIGTFDLPDGTLIVAHDLNTGAERWAVNIPSSFADSWRSRVTGVDADFVYATRSGNTNAEYLYALDPATGAVVWRSDDLMIETTTESIAFTPDGDPITTGGTSGSPTLIRFDRDTGDTLWSTPRTCPTSGGCDAAVFGGRAYFWEASPGGPVITVVDLATGARLYSSDPIRGGFIQQVAPFVGPDGTVYAPRTQNNPLTDFLVAFTDTGTALVEKWRTPLGYVPFATFGVGPDGSVYSYTTNRLDGETEIQIHRLDPDTGAILDSSPVMITNFPAQPRMAIDAAGRVYFTNGGFSHGRLHSFNADLTERWSAPIANVNVGGPILGRGGVLVVCGVGNDLRAYATACAADFDLDGDLTPGDFAAFRAAFLAGEPRADFDGDGGLTPGDFAAFRTAFLAGCP